MLRFMVAAVRDSSVCMVLDSPGLSRQRVSDILLSICEGQINEHGESFIKLLVENNRVSLLPEIMSLYERYSAAAQGCVDAEVTTASEINELQLATIVAALRRRLSKEVRLSSRIDETLVGGAIIRAGDLVIDGSVRGRLDRLALELTN